MLNERKKNKKTEKYTSMDKSESQSKTATNNINTNNNREARTKNVVERKSRNEWGGV